MSDKSANFVALLDGLLRARLSGEVVPLETLTALEDAFNDAVEARVEQRERDARRDW